MHKPPLQSILILALLLHFVRPAMLVGEDESTLRVWKDKTGKFRLEATFEGMNLEKAKLRRKDTGQIIEVFLGALSEADQDFLRKRSPEIFESQSKRIFTAAALQEAAQKRRFAADSLAMFDRFAADPRNVDIEKERAKSLRQTWVTPAAAKKIRIGKTWYTPAEFADLEKDERELLAKAEDYLKVSDFQSVAKKLTQASALNPASIRGDFRLGILAALHQESLSAKDAEKCFLDCTRRLAAYEEQDWTQADRANLAACYNNLALTCIRQTKAAEALRHWESCLKAAPAADPVLHNLAYVQLLARRSSGSKPSPVSLNLTESESQRLDRVCSSVSGLSVAYDQKRGWRYMRLAKIVTESSSTPSSPLPPAPSAGAPSANLVLMGGGTGFVVGKGLIATNRHVVDDAIAFSVRRDGEDRPAARPARIVTVSADKKLDLALLKAELLDAPILALNTKEPKLSAEIRTLGFPKFDLLGSNIKVTSGIITSLPPLRGLFDPNYENYLMHDAVINPGCSGGPLCDRHGLIMGVNTAHFPQLGYSMSASAKEVHNFLKAHVPDLQTISPTEGDVKTWEDAVEKVRLSTVQVLVYTEPDRFEPPKKSGSKATRDTYDDPWCLACYGRGTAECPVRGCINGGVGSFTEQSIRFPNGDVHIKRLPIRVNCDTCRGSGKVACPFCRDGLDPKFSN